MRQFLFLFHLMFVLKANAQDTVAASKEPLHKNVFENQYVRVLDLHIAPGDTTLFHKHEIPVVSVSLHPVRTGSQTIVDDKGPKVSSLDRRITFDGFYQSPRIHRVWNRDTAVFHWMDIEVLAKGDRNLEAPIALDGFTQVFDAPPVRAYRLVLKGNQKVDFKRTAPILIVGLKDASKITANKKRFSKEGDFLFVQPSKKISMANKGEQEFTFAVLELK
ncbi:MAG: hypothetical protein ICV79_26990 [Flavisolibacter sp.]|nr:hypothetical protein [Flavisolibacter sp.]